MMIDIDTHGAVLGAQFTIFAIAALFNGHVKAGGANESAYLCTERNDRVYPASPVTKTAFADHEDEQENEHNGGNVRKKVTDSRSGEFPGAGVGDIEFWRLFREYGGGDHHNRPNGNHDDAEPIDFLLFDSFVVHGLCHQLAAAAGAQPAAESPAKNKPGYKNGKDGEHA
jgi:hypothetical protein